jgi:hypothetical protein
MEEAMVTEVVMDDGSCGTDMSVDVGLDYGGEEQNAENEEDVNEEEESFLKAASASVVHQCISEFIDVTGNEAVHPHICMICAREMWAKEVIRCAVDDIPNPRLLFPNEYHPAHKLTSGMLLERAVLEREKGRLYGDVCEDCSRALNRHRTPCIIFGERNVDRRCASRVIYSHSSREGTRRQVFSSRIYRQVVS